MSQFTLEILTSLPGNDQVLSTKNSNLETQPVFEPSLENDQLSSIENGSLETQLASEVFYPYQPGTSLQLKTKDASFSDSLAVDIIHRIEPSTMSCVMKVMVPGYFSPMILKLFDRRYSSQLRSDYGIPPWTPLVEVELYDFILSGGANRFLDKLRNDDDFEEPPNGWNNAENECDLHDLALDKFKAETKVYERLRDIQGTEIPKAFASVSLTLPGMKEHGDSELFVVNGILMELISGFTLTQMPDQAPQDQWQSIIEEATRVVDVVSDHEVLNKDVRPDNFIISTADYSVKRVCMIDFGEAHLREPDEEDYDWGRAKHCVDISITISLRLKKLGFPLKFERSRRYWRWAECESPRGDRGNGGPSHHLELTQFNGFEGVLRRSAKRAGLEAQEIPYADASAYLFYENFRINERE